MFDNFQIFGILLWILWNVYRYFFLFFVVFFLIFFLLFFLQLLCSTLMEILKPGCPRNVESWDTSLSWLYPRSIGSQCKIKDQRYCVGSWPSMLGVLVTDDSCSCHLWGSVRDEGANVGQQEQPGGEAGTLTHFLTRSVSHCQFMFQTLQQLVRMVLYLGCKGQRAVLSSPPCIRIQRVKFGYHKLYISRNVMELSKLLRLTLKGRWTLKD